MKIRLSESGEPQEVIRVTPGAAYVGRKVRREYVVFDKKTGEAKVIERVKLVVEPISRNAFVFPVEDECQINP